jgi:aconitate hydratase
MSGLSLVQKRYATLAESHAAARRKLGRPLTLAEKILVSHLDDPAAVGWKRGVDFLMLRPDRIAMQDATAQMALLQFMMAGKPEVDVPTTVHCDHLILAHKGAGNDLLQSLDKNEEVYEFLASVSRKYGIGFWRPGSGIIHQVVLENYAFPGGLMIGTDSHTPNAGGLGMAACGVGGADAVDVMVGFPWEVLAPKLIGVRLTGKLSGWASAKDVILKVCQVLTVKGGTNAIVEYFGPGARSISCTGKATVCNMGAEHGATTSVFPFDAKMAAYLRATERAGVAELAEAHAAALQADPEVEADPERFFDRVVSVDLDELEPQITGPHTPDLARPISAMAKEAIEKDYPLEVTNCLIGSCTNSSYEDMSRAAHVARQAASKGLKAKVPLWVTPGSDTVQATIQRDGQMAALESIGAVVLANACGPCIGQWKRDDIKPGERNSIVNSFNRNFAKRNDGNAATLSFIASPELVTAIALSGRLDFDPRRDTLDGLKLDAPEGAELPDHGLVTRFEGFQAPAKDGGAVEVAVAENSPRLQLLAPFDAWNGNDFEDLLVLLKAQGKCTTDHISPAGPWLEFRGHLDKISDNLFIGAVNAFSGDAGKVRDALDGQVKATPRVARHYRQAGRRWVVFGDENYGEGSSREHAAMEPRFLGAAAIIVRSFARIHETNLKKQGLLPLTFANPADYERIREDDKVALGGLTKLAPGSAVTVTLRHSDGSSEQFDCRHSFNREQIEWFRAGSALNLIRQKRAKRN